MTEWTFRLNLAGLDVDDEGQLDRLYAAGCDDATFATDENGAYAVFHRAASAVEQAVLSAILAVASVGDPVRVVRVVDEDDWLTAAEIAERTGRSRQSVGLLVSGDRGPGGFPAPVARQGARSPLWSWLAVEQWFARYAPGELPAKSDRMSPDFLAAVNDRLDLRERRRQAPHAPWWPGIAAAVPLAG